jgi:hypothetical protein
MCKQYDTVCYTYILLMRRGGGLIAVVGSAFFPVLSFTQSEERLRERGKELVKTIYISIRKQRKTKENRNKFTVCTYLRRVHILKILYLPKGF